MIATHHKEVEVSTTSQDAIVIKHLITPAEIAAVLQDAGFRADVIDEDGKPRVRSAVQGLAFSICFVSPPEGEQQYSDFSFHCPLRIKGSLPDGIVNRWNRNKRFARLVRNEHFLYVTMDVMLSGGVTSEHLRAQCELWDRLIRELFMHLQQPVNEAPAFAPTAVA